MAQFHLTKLRLKFVGMCVDEGTIRSYAWRVFMQLF
jgi:hypothetical protein